MLNRFEYANHTSHYQEPWPILSAKSRTRISYSHAPKRLVIPSFLENWTLRFVIEG
jgi:hypothetical protein